MDHVIPQILLIAVLLCAGCAAAAAAEPTEPAATLKADKKDGILTITKNGREVLRYRSTPGGMPAGYDASFLRGGYIEAVFTPSGTLVSDDYPPGHKHHHGIWSPWTKTVFEGRHPDFWNMGDKTGTVEPVSLGDASTKDGAVAFQAKHRMVDLKAPGAPKA